MEEKIEIIFFTDPICSTCWGVEPHIKKFKLEYGHLFNIEYRMGGLLPFWEKYSSVTVNKPIDVAKHWDEKSIEYKMPIDGDLWKEDPLESSFPPSIAFKAATIQNQQLALKFLRRLREMVFTEKKNITKWEYLSKAAIETGLDILEFKKDFEGKGKELFYKDLELAKKYEVKIFPTILMSNHLGHSTTIKGYNAYSVYEEALMKLYFKSKKKYYNKEGLDLFDEFQTLTTKEFADLKGVSVNEAEGILDKLEKINKLKGLKIKNGNIWTKNKLTIIGGGIAGLTLGNLLEKKGIDYQIFEKNPDLDEKGHGFIVPNQGIEILSSILSEEIILNCGNKLESHKAFDHKGNKLVKIELDNTFILSRRLLIQALLKTIPINKIHHGKEFKELDVKNALVNEIEFNGIGNSRINPEMVVAADGVNSKIRKKTFPDSYLSPVSENEIVSIIKDKKLAKSLGSCFKKYIHKDGGLTFGMLRLSKKEIIWFVQFDTNKYNPELHSPINKKKFLEKHFSHWCDPIPYLIKNTDFNKSYLWKVFELNNIESHNKNNILFLGDAAHPIIPLTSKGVTQALKDAKLFSDLLDKNPIDQKADVEYLFKQYNEIRMRATEQNNKTGNDLLKNFQLPLEEQMEYNLPIVLD